MDITKEQYTAQFKDILDIYQQLVCKRLLARLPCTTGFSPNSDPVVIDVTKCIAVMCRYI